MEPLKENQSELELVKRAVLLLHLQTQGGLQRVMWTSHMWTRFYVKASMRNQGTLSPERSRILHS